VLFHKGFAAYALGSAWAQTHTLKQAWPLLFFIAATPVGILIGALVMSVSGPEVRALIQALAAGTVLYVGVHDILQPALKAPGMDFIKWLCASAGFIAMALLAIWA